MKIQTKKGLLHTFRDDPSRVDYEVKAFVKSNHPYIINLDYAFQTDSLAIMVLGLAGILIHRSMHSYLHTYTCPYLYIRINE